MSTTLAAFSRRAFMAGLGALALPLPLRAQQGLLPINTPRLDHLDVIVPDVAASARFYMGVFNTKLHAQPFQGGFRYFILLGELGPGREVGYVAIGDSRGRGTYIGHFCTSVVNWRQNSAAIMAALTDAVAQAGLGKITTGGGVGGIFSDPDGIEIQFLPAPDTLVTAAVPSDLVPHNQGLVTPRGVDHVLLHVANLEKGLQFYRILYGKESVVERNPARAWFQIGPTRLGLQEAPAGQKPKIDHFGIKVAPFDRARVTEALTKLGAKVEPVQDNIATLKFRDLDGIPLELVAE